MNWSLLSESLLIFIVTVFENLCKRNLGFSHVWDGDSPVVVCGTECDCSVCNGNLPAFLEFFRSELLDKTVDLFDGLSKSSHHVFRSYLQLIDETVNLVDEKNWLYLLFQCLTNDGFSLRHWAFDCTCKDETSVNSTHSTCYVATEVNVTGCVDEINQVVGTINAVNHRCGCCIDGNTTSGFLLIEIENTSCACKVTGHHACSRNEVV